MISRCSAGGSFAKTSSAIANASDIGDSRPGPLCFWYLKNYTPARPAAPQEIRTANAGEGDIMSDYNFHVAGTFYREEALERMLQKNPEFDATKADILATHNVEGRVYRYFSYITPNIAFIPEPTNQNDPNAIRIEIDGHFVGYVKRGSTSRIRNLLSTPGVTVSATVFGGPCRSVYIDDYGCKNLQYLETPFEAAYTFRTPDAQGADPRPQYAYTQQGNPGSCQSCGDVPPQTPPALHCTACGAPATPQGYCSRCGRYIGVPY